MFISGEVLLDVSFAAAQARLASLARGGSLLRREAAGPYGRLFPALDADITLTPAGQQATVLELAGAYRPPLGAAGRLQKLRALS